MTGKKLDVWYAKGVRFECQKSAKCCVNHGEYAFVFLSQNDEARLLKHLDLEQAEFRSRYTELNDEGDRVLLSRDDACIFLEGHACGVYQARPTQCETWPFWAHMLDEDVWQREVASFCPGVGKGKLHTREEIETRARRTEQDDHPMG